MEYPIESSTLGPRAVDKGQFNPDSGLDIQQWAMEEIRKVIFHAIDERKIDVFLFGSRARGDSRPLSDADIALDNGGKPLPRIWLARLREQLEESLVPFSVEIVDLTEADPNLRQEILRDGIRWAS